MKKLTKKKIKLIFTVIIILIVSEAHAQTISQKDGELCLNYKGKTYVVHQYKSGEDDYNYYSLQWNPGKSDEIPRGLVLITDRNNKVITELTRDDAEYCPEFILYDIDGDEYQDLILFWHTGTHSTFAEAWINSKKEYIKVFEVFNANGNSLGILDVVDVTGPGPFTFVFLGVISSEPIAKLQVDVPLDDSVFFDNLELAFANSNLKGQATDKNTGDPIAQALVIALGPTRARTKTDSSGFYEIPDLSQGTWRILCWKRGYKFQIKTVTLAPGETQTVDFSLMPKAGSRDDDIPPEFRDAVNAAPALSSPKGKLTTTWGAIKKR